MSTTAQVLDPGTVVLAEGLINWGNQKALEVQDLIRVVAGVGAVVGILHQAVKSGFALARIATSIAVAGLLVWGVWNVTAVKDKVGEEVTTSSAVVPVLVDEVPLNLLSPVRI